MSRRRLVRRIALGVGALVVVALVAAGVLGWSIARRALPDLSGEIALAGLSGPVTIERDARGVPSIYADNLSDLARAQGYVHAQDRFFEMDLRRHITAGRLSELVGSAGIETDKVIRTMDWRGVAEKELPTLDASTRQFLQAYAAGVNAWIKQQGSPAKMALEYSVLGLKFPDYAVEDWTPVDSLAWLKAMAWDLRGDYSDELTRAQLAGRMSLAQIAEIYPPYPYADHRAILAPTDWPATTTSSAGSSAPSGLRAAATVRAQSAARAAAVEALAATRSPAGQDAYASVRLALDAIPTLVGRGDGVGSNSWVVSGSRSSTGKPILANDPHLAVGIPGIWYQSSLHCRVVSAACPLNVSGFGFSGVPGIVIGHNGSIAWGFTNLGPDVSDFYLEKVQNDTVLQDGSWVPLTVRTERIKVAGGADVTVTVRSSRHGPILSGLISDLQRAADTAPVTGGSPDETYAVALDWTGLHVGQSMDAVLGFNTATTFEQFRSAAAKFAVPSQNLVYADTAGHIGYQAPGLIPIRTPAFTGSPAGFWPAPGWTTAYDWRGFVPFDQLPTVEDPKEGFIVAANQAVTDAATPFLTTEWDYGFRSQQIRNLLSVQPKQSVASMAKVQMDDHSLFAPDLVAALTAIDLGDDSFTREAQQLLTTWDFSNPADDSPAASASAYFNAVWANLVRLTFDDELPAGLQAKGGGQWMQAMRLMLKNTKSPWWDNKSTPGVVETRNEILRQALVAARLDLTKKLGKDPGGWRWGTLHRLDLTHRILGGTDMPAPVRAIFNRGGYAMPGGGAIVNANAWDASKDYSVYWGPSMRMVVDLANLDNSVWVNQTGQSGHPYSPNYDDQIDAWVSGSTYPWPFTEDAVSKASQNQLRLVPTQTP